MARNGSSRTARVVQEEDNRSATSLINRSAEDVNVGKRERSVAVIALQRHRRERGCAGSGNGSKPGKFEKKKVPLRVFLRAEPRIESCRELILLELCRENVALADEGIAADRCRSTFASVPTT